MMSEVPLWLIAFWVVMGGAIGVCLIAVYILMCDYLHETENPPRTEIRDRLRHLPKP